jgi:hypothetical protein
MFPKESPSVRFPTCQNLRTMKRKAFQMDCGITRPCSPGMLDLLQVAVLAYCARGRDLPGLLPV